MDANILGSVGIGLSQGLEKGLQSAYQINRQGMMDRIQIQKMAEDSQYKQQDMAMKQNSFEQQKKEFELKLHEYDMKFATIEQYSAFDAYAVDGDVEHLNRLLKRSPLTKERAGAVRFEKLNPNEEADKRLLANEHGLSEITPAVSKNYIKAIKPDGSVQIMPMHGLYTVTGYATAKDKETRAKLMEDAELAFKQESARKAGAEADYYGSKGSAEGGEQFYKTQKAKKEYTDSMIEEVAISNPEAVGAAVISDENEIDFNGAIMPVAKVAKAAQGKNDMSATDRQYLDGLYDASISFKAIKTKLEDDKIDRNALKKAWSEIASISGAEMAKMTPADREQFLNKLSLDSETRLAAAAFIKAMSGSAVSDAERAYYLDLITKGDWSTKEAALATIEGFRTGLNRSYENKLDSLKNFVPYDVYTRRGQRKNLIGEKAYGKRNDGTDKGSGWLGELQLPNGGVATEYTVGVNIGGKEVDIPTLVPTLTDQEVKLMVEDIIPNKKQVPDTIMKKATDFAKSNLKSGKSLFKPEVKRDAKGIPLPSKQTVENSDDTNYRTPPPPAEVVNAIEPGEIIKYQGKQGKVLKNVSGEITVEFEDGTKAKLKAPK